jgi:hypothetical protein
MSAVGATGGVRLPTRTCRQRLSPAMDHDWKIASELAGPANCLRSLAVDGGCSAELGATRNRPRNWSPHELAAPSRPMRRQCKLAETDR